MAKRFDCLGLGIAPADILMQIEKYPEPGAKIDAVGLTIQGGGPIPTAMVTMARLGMKPALMAAVGDDIFGRFVIDELNKEGVDTSGVIVRRKPTAIACGWVENGSGRRTIVAKLSLHLSPRDIKYSSLPNFRAAHLDGRDLDACMKLARFARRKNVPVILDVGSMRNDVSALLPLVDHLICAEAFALPYTRKKNVKSAIECLRYKCLGTIVVTSGIRGSTGFSEETGFIRQGAFKVKTVDTTGAGDVYHGAYIVGLLDRMSLKQRMELASAAAAMKCTRPGGRTGIPTMHEVRAFIKSGVPRYA